MKTSVAWADHGGKSESPRGSCLLCTWIEVRELGVSVGQNHRVKDLTPVVGGAWSFVLGPRTIRYMDKVKEACKESSSSR